MRLQTMAVTATKPAVINLTVVRGETLALTLVGSEAPRHILTISGSPGGAPLIELPASGLLITLEPAALQMLQEGQVYYYNIWAQSGSAPGSDRMQLVSGRLMSGDSIAPSGADYATTFLDGFGLQDGPQRLIVLTKAQYQSLAPPDPAVLYLIREVT